MTTTISFATRDCVVIGCDSLATTTVPMLDPFRLLNDFFDQDDGLSLKKDEEGEPKLKTFQDLQAYIEAVPYNQLPNVTKIFDLKPAKIGILFAGTAVIAGHSIRNLVDAFKAEDEIAAYLAGNYTVRGTAKRLYDYISTYYEDEVRDSPVRPQMEIIVSGYSKRYNQPEVQIIEFGDASNEGVTQSVGRGGYDIVFGGQYDVIYRVINGLDLENYVRYTRRIDEITHQYRDLIQKDLASKGIDIDIATAQELDESVGLDLYSLDWVRGITADLPNFSEQASIEFVDFLVEVMCRAQQFSNRLPTVGGDVHIAIITKSAGFRWISKEEYTYRGRGVPKHD